MLWLMFPVTTHSTFLDPVNMAEVKESISEVWVIIKHYCP